MTDAVSFASFWAGDRLSAFEIACLRSFTRHGYAVTLYSYEPIENVPPGVTPGRAADIARPDTVNRFRTSGSPSLSHFSDYFRYLLFQKTDHIWIDADMLLLRPIDRALPRTILAREDARSLCGAIMRLDNGNPRLETLIERTEAVMDRDLLWGETGPMLLTKVFDDDSLVRQSLPPAEFFPLSCAGFWQAFLPETRDHCEAQCSNAFAVHLWNNVVDRLGIWKKMAPPAGSFLHARFEADETLRYFDDVYPAAVMRQMVENWLLRKSGQDLGVKALAGQVLPSIVRTARHYGFARRR